MKTWKIMFTLMMATAVLASAAFAAPARLTSITAGAKNPVRVAVDSQGNLYLAEASENKITKFDASGNPAGSIDATYPLSVAVDASGNIFAGCMVSSKKQGLKNVVNIFAPNFAKIGSLGAGEGEFTFPVDITIDGSGKIYVADKDANTVSIYDPTTRAKVMTLGGFGNANGQLTRPTSVAVNDANGEIFVADAPQVTTANGLTSGARISVFDQNGAFLRSFGQFGVGAGQMTSPEDLAIDQAGQLYVVDSYQGAALIMNPADGSSVGAGALFDANSPMYNPSGIAITKNGLVYIASKKGAGAGLGSKDRIDVYSLDGYLMMDVTPKALDFSAIQYTANPPAQTIVIANSGSGTLQWQATADASWIQLAQASGTAGPNSSMGLGVSVDISKLTLGVYQGTVTIDSGYGQKQAVTVTLTVDLPAMLSISNQTLKFTSKKGQAAAPQSVTISIANPKGSMTWSAASSATWLSISPASGSAQPGVATIAVNTSGMSAGSYTGSITISAAGAYNNSQLITVDLTVAANKIAVSTNRPDARFTVSGPATYSGNGATWNVEGVPAGDYTVTFDAVAGFKRPFAQSQKIADDGEVTFNAKYVSFQELAAKKNIVAAKGPAATNDSSIKFYKGNGAPASADLLALTTTYGANVAVGDVDGDGSAEIIVGAGDGPNNAATVRVYHADKSLLLEFVPLGTMNGVRVAAADLNGDGKAEIIVSPAGGSENTGTVAVYTLEGGKMVATGIEMAAFPSAYGANLAVADLDGNGKPYIVTSTGFSRENPATVRVWKVDASQGTGKWTATQVREVALGGSYGATVAAADMDGDGIDEIIVGTGGIAKGDASLVTVIRADGTQTSFKAFERYGVNVAAADLDGDGKAEIIAAAGRGASGEGRGSSSGKMQQGGKDNHAEFDGTDSEAGTIRVMNGAGTVKFVIRPFDNAKEGVNVTVGDLGL